MRPGTHDTCPANECSAYKNSGYPPHTLTGANSHWSTQPLAPRTRELGKGNLGVFALDNRVRALKALKPSVNIVPNKEAFASWRAAYEAQEQEGGLINKRQRTEAPAPVQVDPADFFAGL